MLSDGLGVLGWWQNADLLTRGMYIFLLVSLAATWSMIVVFSLRLGRLEKLELRLRGNDETLTPSLLQSVLSFKLVKQCRDACHERSGQIFETRLFSALHRQRLSWQTIAVGLAAIGLLAPVVGVFGSVWMVLTTLRDVDAMGNGIGVNQLVLTLAVSFIPTIISLLVTIPALTGYRLLHQRTQRVIGLVEANIRRLCQRMSSRGWGSSFGAAA